MGHGVLPPAAELLALALAALCDQIDRDDAAHARRRLLADLAQALGRPVQWQPPTAAPDAPTPDGHLALPLKHLGHDLGALRIGPAEGAAPLAPSAAAAALAPVVQALGTLLLRERADRDRVHAPGPAGVAAPGSAGQLLRAALRGAGTFIWEWDIPSDRLGDIDEGFEQLGYDAAPGRRTQDDWNTLIHPDDRDANHEAYLQHARGERAFYEHVYRARAADGRWHWLQERGRIVEWLPDGAPRRMVGTQLDITERRRAEAQAQEALLRLRKIAAHVPGALFQYVRTDEGVARFPYISERCIALFGLTPEEMAEDASAMLRRVHPAERAGILSGIEQSARAQQPWQCEFSVRRRDGITRRVRGAATPQPEADGSIVWHGYFEDVTEAATLARAEHDKQLAEAANRTKTEFLSRMSHELRTPLNAVLGFAQLMTLDGGDTLTGDQQRRLALIRQSGEHLLAMIEDLLDLTSIEAGRLPLTLEAVPLAALVDDAIAMVQAAAQRHDLQLLREGAPGLSAWADRKRLRQVLINLLSNAIKYNRPGGQVRVVVERVGTMARLQVHDTGVGLTAQECAQLFEPFNRLGHARGPIEGTGIGLTVTRGLVNLMEGTIDVQSTPGLGSCFAVSLPAAPEA